MLSAIKKEIIEGMRTYRFLIILAVFLFFSLLNPVMNKMILPDVLKSQFEGLDDATLSQMVISSQTDCLRAYLGDVFEIVTLVIVFSLSSMVAGELSSKTFIIPRCSGKSFAMMITAKLIVYGVFILLVSVIGALIDFVYAGMLFGADMSSIRPAINGGVLQGLYYIYILGFVILIGSFFKKPISAGLAALIPAYGTSIISQLLDADRFLPSGLLREASMLTDNLNTDILLTIIITIAATVVLAVLTVLRLETIELSKK